MLYEVITDLQIYNPTDQPYQLNVYLTDDHLVGSWNTTSASKLRYEIYEKEHSMTQQSWGGYVRHNLIFRRVFNVEGELVDDQYVTRITSYNVCYTKLLRVRPTSAA